jgi:hypothetical protein
MTRSLLQFVLTCAGLRLLSCQDNNVCIRLRKIRAKTQLSRLANWQIPGAVQLWVTTTAGPSPAATPTGPTSRRPSGRPECPPLPLPGPTCPGRSRPVACGHRTATPVASAIGEPAIALQLTPGYLQAPDRGGHPLRWRRTIAGQSSALKAGTAGRLADFCPLAAPRALMCGAEGKPVLRHGAGQAGAIDDGFGFDPVTAPST